MFRRTLNVVFRPMKNNYVLLPDSYYRVVSTYVSISSGAKDNQNCGRSDYIMETSFNLFLGKWLS